MCGIAGISSTNVPSAEQRVRLMTDALRSRGPDHHGVMPVPGAALGHTRLSIIDLDPRSNQPMSDASGRYVLVFNGEIYNYRELRQELIAAGATFTCSGDTEVLLQGLVYYGERLLPKLNGFFAFAFYDTVRKHLLLARDRYGIKPLFYSLQGGECIFGSSLKSVLLGMKHYTLDEASLRDYLQLSYVPGPASMITEVKKLQPGHMLRIADTQPHIEQWYKLPSRVRTTFAAGEATSQFAHLLEKSVQRRLVSDVPLGCFLSGGFDSAVITMLASRSMPNLPAFTVTFPEHAEFDEGQAAQAVAQQLGVQHHLIPLSNSDLTAALPRIFESCEEPLADSSALLVNLLSEGAGKSIRVALSGDGADELLGGYVKHRALLRSLAPTVQNGLIKRSRRLWNYLPEARRGLLLNTSRQLKRYSYALGLPLEERYLAWASWTKAQKVEALLRRPMPSRISIPNIDAGNLNTLLAADMDLVLANDMLVKVDTMSMQHGLEVRLPFLDHQVVDALFSFPSSFKMNQNQGKLILKQAFEAQFPKHFWRQPKRGFEMPIDHWMKAELKEWCERYLNKPYLNAQGLFDAAAVSALQKAMSKRAPGDTAHTLWALLVFQAWYERTFP